MKSTFSTGETIDEDDQLACSDRIDMPAGSDVENFSIITGSHNLIKDGSGGVPGTITGDPMLTASIY